MYKSPYSKKYKEIENYGIKSRCFETDPYSEDELRVVQYLKEIIPDVGAGDDPILFLISSHSSLVADRAQQLLKQENDTSNGLDG